MASKQKNSPTRSIRIDEETWGAAKRRAESEGVSVSRALYLLTEGYSRGMINLPKVRLVYDTNK